MITLILAITMAQATPATTKPKPNYIIDGQTVSIQDAIKYAVREPRHEIYECKRMELVIKDRSARLVPRKAQDAADQPTAVK